MGKFAVHTGDGGSCYHLWGGCRAFYRHVDAGSFAVKSKFRIQLRDDVAGVVMIDLYIPQNVVDVLLAKYTKEELDNITGQEFQRIIDLLALDEE